MALKTGHICLKRHGYWSCGKPAKTMALCQKKRHDRKWFIQVFSKGDRVLFNLGKYQINLYFQAILWPAPQLPNLAGSGLKLQKFAAYWAQLLRYKNTNMPIGYSAWKNTLLPIKSSIALIVLRCDCPPFGSQRRRALSNHSKQDSAVSPFDTQRSSRSQRLSRMWYAVSFDYCKNSSFAPVRLSLFSTSCTLLCNARAWPHTQPDRIRNQLLWTARSDSPTY